MKHVPRKRFGQHFLRDAAVLGRIVDAVAPRRGDVLVEIGPGTGALTSALLERVDHLHAIELDRDLCAMLRSRYPADRLTLHEGDALRFDFARLPAPLRLVGNLPYNISTPLLFHVSASAARLEDAHFMLQQEVADRLAAAPGSRAYGRLSVMLQYRLDIVKLFTVPPVAFRPPPQVESAVVRLVPRPPAELRAADEARFAAIVARAFSTRRKVLRNALADMVPAERLSALGIDPGLRAEDLPVAAFVDIANSAT